MKSPIQKQREEINRELKKLEAKAMLLGALVPLSSDNPGRGLTLEELRERGNARREADLLVSKLLKLYEPKH